jgi:hypothetical protein
VGDFNRALELDPNNAHALEQRELLPQQFGQELSWCYNSKKWRGAPRL